MNLLKETKEALRNKGYKWPDDILSIQGSDRGISVGLFEKLANVNYDNGYGLQEVAEDLVILMKDGTWFDRGEYDGAEWWRHHRHPEKLEVNDEGVDRIIKAPRGYFWGTLKDVNTPLEEDDNGC